MVEACHVQHGEGIGGGALNALIAMHGRHANEFKTRMVPLARDYGKSLPHVDGALQCICAGVKVHSKLYSEVTTVRSI